MKENIVVFEDGGNDNVVGWRGASTITMDWNGREERIYIYIEEIKNDVWMERKSGKWSGFLKKIKKQTNFQHIFYLFYKKKIINSTKHVFF